MRMEKKINKEDSTVDIICRNCDKYDTNGFVPMAKKAWCKELKRVVDGDFYCAHGERKNDDKG